MSKSPSLRRIQADIRELALDPSDRYHAAPLETDMFEWHFTIRGADDTDFAGGVYHGRIMLPPEYPFKPPHIIFLTPSGRFETNTKVCLSFSAYHPELWQPAWGIRLILEALISFLPTPADGAIGALDWTSAERKRLAKKSLDYHCPTCGCKAVDLLPELKPKSDSEKPKSKFQKEIEKLQQLQHAQHAEKKEQDETKDTPKEEDNKTRSKEEGASAAKDENEPLLKEEEKEQPKSGETKVEEPATAEPAKPAAAPVDNSPATTPAQPAPAVQQIMQQPQPVQEQAPQQAAHEEIHQLRAGNEGVGSWMVDPILHGIIVVLAVLCLLLWRKLHDMIEELEQLTEVLEA